MKLDDYRDADCRLFRLPPIDTSRIEDLLAQQLVQAWQHGATAQDALQRALNNDELVGSLVGELEEHIGFQQKIETQNVEAEVQANITAYDAEKEQRVAAINQSIAAEKQAKKDALDSVQGVVDEKRQVYSAEQLRLQEMRERVEAKLRAVGGDKKLEMLLQIHTAVQSTKVEEQLPESGKSDVAQTSAATTGTTTGTYSGTKHEGYEPKPVPKVERKKTATQSSYVLPKTDGGVSGTTYNQPAVNKDTTVQQITLTEGGLEAKVGDESAIVPTAEKQRGKLYRAAHAVWKVLNYKIW